MLHDEAACSLEEPCGSDEITQHTENACTFAVRDGVETVQDARDVPVVLLHHGVTLFLSVSLKV